MSRLRLIAVILVLAVAVPAVFAQEHGDDPPHWSYEGEEGPEHWGDLSEDYATCADGTAQSPIDLGDAIGVDLSNIEFHYGETMLNIFNNGHTVQVNVEPGSTITYNGIEYELLQFHFHHPSEHTYRGETANMELHLVHREPASGNLAVVGVLLLTAEEDNPAYPTVFNNLPDANGDAVIETSIMIDLGSLLPESKTFFTYQGSLTTPPCSEIVRWLLLDTTVDLSEAQIESFATIFENDARPVQPHEGRDVLQDTSE